MTDPKSIVLHMNGGERDSANGAVAAALAARFGARLEGLFAPVPPYVPATIDGMMTPQIVQIQRDINSKRAAAARAAFDAAARGLKSGAEFVEQDMRAMDLVIRRGRYADLTVIGQASPEETDVATDFDLPADLVMALGRPVLIVPYAGDFTDVGRRVLVAWNGSRESARAAADAIPLIKGAEQVMVLMVNPGEGSDAMGAEVKAYFARHGIAARPQTARTDEIEVDDVLLSTAADVSADMIVMGAYGRSRMREMILGGATHGLLKHMTAPVLMSH